MAADLSLLRRDHPALKHAHAKHKRRSPTGLCSMKPAALVCLVLLFAAVDHLNKGRHYLDTEEERIDLIKLNQTSSEKARARRALFSAANFSSKAIDLVKFEHDWMNHYYLLLHVYNDAAKLNLACGRFDAEQLFWLGCLCDRFYAFE